MRRTYAPRVGNARFGFKLDSAQAAVENGILAAFPDLFIGLAANASKATGGLETFSVGVSGLAVPEPGSYALVGAGLVWPDRAPRKVRLLIQRIPHCTAYFFTLK
jgi:hypothetical protein